MDKKKIPGILEKFGRARILVLGDIMLDEYIQGSVERISPEAPIPVVNINNSGKRDIRLGGAANVFNNILSLGCRKLYLCGVAGSDPEGKHILNRLKAAGCDTAGVIADKNRPTTLKTRIVSHNQQVIRLDREESAPLSRKTMDTVISFIKSRIDDIDAIVISDYEKGVVSPEILEAVLPLAKSKNILTAVDPKFSNFRFFKNTTIIVPNRKEAAGFVHYDISDNGKAVSAANQILESLECECVLIKLGERGMAFVDRKGLNFFIDTAAEQVYDVTGAGDTVISALVLSRLSGASWREASLIANIAAGVVIHYLGTTIITIEQLKSALANKQIKS